MKKVSIIVPVFNTQQYLLENCIISIINQDYEDIEIIIVDDGSTKETAEFCDQLSKRCERIIVYHTMNNGVSSARNYGIDRASGDLLMFVDSDDYILRNMVSRLVSELNNHDADCVICGCFQTKDYSIQDINNEGNLSVKVFDQNDMMNALNYMQHPFPQIEMTAVWGALYKAEVIGNTRFDESCIVGEDYLFKFLLFHKMDKLVCTEYTGYIYHIVETSLMNGNFNIKKVNTIHCLENFIQNHENIKYMDGFKSRAVNIAFVIYVCMPAKGFESEKEKIVTFVNKYKRNVLWDKLTRKKVKIAILFSFFNFRMVRLLFQLIRFKGFR